MTLTAWNPGEEERNKQRGKDKIQGQEKKGVWRIGKKKEKESWVFHAKKGSGWKSWVMGGGG